MFVRYVVFKHIVYKHPIVKLVKHPIIKLVKHPIVKLTCDFTCWLVWNGECNLHVYYICTYMRTCISLMHTSTHTCMQAHTHAHTHMHTHKHTRTLTHTIPYKQKYWRTLYLVVRSNNAVGGILNWRISVLYGEKPILVV